MSNKVPNHRPDNKCTEIYKPNNSFFVYWDDFLFPTSYFHSNELKNFDEARLERNKDVLFGELDSKGKKFLRSLIQYGNVSILSTRKQSWIKRTRKLVPKLDSFIKRNKLLVYGIDSIVHPLKLLLPPWIIQGANNLLPFVGSKREKHERQIDGLVRKWMKDHFFKDSKINFIFFGSSDDELRDSRRLISAYKTKYKDPKLGFKLVWLSGSNPKPDFIVICLHKLNENIKRFIKVEKSNEIVRVPRWNQEKIPRKNILNDINRGRNNE